MVCFLFCLLAAEQKKLSHYFFLFPLFRLNLHLKIGSTNLTDLSISRSRGVCGLSQREICFNDFRW